MHQNCYYSKICLVLENKCDQNSQGPSVEDGYDVQDIDKIHFTPNWGNAKTESSQDFEETHRRTENLQELLRQYKATIRSTAVREWLLDKINFDLSFIRLGPFGWPKSDRLSVAQQILDWISKNKYSH